MEMPEGWSRFATNTADSSLQSIKDRHLAANLIKEMAEALEELEKGGHVSYWNLPGSRPRIVLKKFKEWK